MYLASCNIYPPVLYRPAPFPLPGHAPAAMVALSGRLIPCPVEVHVSLCDGDGVSRVVRGAWEAGCPGWVDGGWRLRATQGSVM